MSKDAIFYSVLGGIYTVLIVASITIFLLRKMSPQRNWTELRQRISSWWLIIFVFSLAMVSPKWLALTIFRSD